MRIAVGSDHAGYDLKTAVVAYLNERGLTVVDLGTTNATSSVDYPVYGAAVGRAVSGGDVACGVAICGTGIGVSIAANKVAGVRAALVHDVTTARLAKEHNDVNVLCFGARVTGTAVVLDALAAWLDAEPAATRHRARIAQLGQLDRADVVTTRS